MIFPYLILILACGYAAGQGSLCPTRCKDSEVCTQILGKWSCLYQKKNAEHNQLLEKINAERTKHGLRPLHENAYLNAAAQKFAEQSATLQLFGHSGPEGSLPWDRAWKEGFEGKSVGENVVGDHNVDRAHTALMNSAVHRANILSSGYSQVGIGVSPDSRFGKFYVQLFGDGPDSQVSSAVVVPPSPPSLPPPSPPSPPPQVTPPTPPLPPPPPMVVVTLPPVVSVTQVPHTPPVVYRPPSSNPPVAPKSLVIGGPSSPASEKTRMQSSQPSGGEFNLLKNKLGNLISAPVHPDPKKGAMWPAFGQMNFDWGSNAVMKQIFETLRVNAVK